MAHTLKHSSCCGAADIRTSFKGGDLKFNQIVAACKNIGYDLTCGQCAAVFYTGFGNYPHAENCATVELQNDTITALRAEVKELRAINQELTFEQLANGKD